VFSPEMGVRKPHARMYRAARDGLGVSALECLYVGDGGSRELTGAVLAGMHPVLIRVPEEEAQGMYRVDEDHWQGATISSLSQVLDLLGSDRGQRSPPHPTPWSD